MQISIVGLCDYGSSKCIWLYSQTSWTSDGRKASEVTGTRSSSESASATATGATANKANFAIRPNHTNTTTSTTLINEKDNNNNQQLKPNSILLCKSAKYITSVSFYCDINFLDYYQMRAIRKMKVNWSIVNNTENCLYIWQWLFLTTYKKNILLYLYDFQTAIYPSLLS